MTTAARPPDSGPPAAEQPRAERARVSDVPGIFRLIQHWAEETGAVLPRTEGEIYESLRDFIVIREGGRVIAAGALHIEWKDLAEVKSLVVEPGVQISGLGRAIVEACLEEAVALELRTVFALTTIPGFFEKLDFKRAAVASFPRKVWNECFRCAKYENCDEVAFSIDLSDRLA